MRSPLSSRMLLRPIHALEPLEDRYLMSGTVLANAQSGDTSAARFAPVYAKLSDGQTVRLGYIQYHNALDLAAAASAAAAAQARGGDGSATIWKPSITSDGLILLTPVAREGGSSGASAHAGSS